MFIVCLMCLLPLPVRPWSQAHDILPLAQTNKHDIILQYALFQAKYLDLPNLVNQTCSSKNQLW